jgi:hypothetical protein
LDKVIDWLLQGPPWIQYRTRLDLLGQSESEADVIAARQAMLSHPQVQILLSELKAWPGPALKRHNDAGIYSINWYLSPILVLRRLTPVLKKSSKESCRTSPRKVPFRSLLMFHLYLEAVVRIS